MTGEEKLGRNQVPGFFSNLAGILLRPSSTMSRILDERRYRWIIPLVLLALLSESLDGVDLGGLGEAVGDYSPVLLALTVLGVIVLVAIVVIVLFGLLAGVATLAGRYLLEGKGSFREVLLALAWGLSPVVVAILYRVPVALLIGPVRGTVARISGHQVVWSPDVLGSGHWALAIVFGLVELAFFGWYVVASSRTLAVAHRFTGWHGFACLLLAWISPALIVVAAVLTAITS